MKKNMGIFDKIIRFLFAIIIAYLIYSKVVVGVWAIVLGIFGVIFLITIVTGFCGLYPLFGINTCSAKEKK
jgi:hypothetical protein